MGKDLRGKEIGQGLSQRKDGYYVARYTDRYGKRIQKLFLKMREAQKWLSENKYEEQHSNIDFPSDLIVESWFQYWISIKEKTVRPNTVRNYRERYTRNIKPIIGNKLLRDVNSIHCQQIFNKMDDEGYRKSTIYQTRIALYNMLQYAFDNDVIRKNPCTRAVISDIGKESAKKEALTIETQKKFLEYASGMSYEYQYRFILQTGLRTGELTGLKWEDIDFKGRTLTVSRSLEYRHSIFLCKTGAPVKNSTYDTALFKICDKAKIPRFSMHVLRHTFATRCIEAGMMPKTLQTILGHSNIGITMNLYVHTTDDQKKIEIEKVAKALKVV